MQSLIYVVMKDPALESRMPDSRMLCGESPVVLLCEELAKAAPMSLVFEVEDKPAVADTLVAKTVQLLTKYVVSVSSIPNFVRTNFCTY